MGQAGERYGGRESSIFLVRGLQIISVNKCSYPDIASNGKNKLGGWEALLIKKVSKQ